MKLSNLISRLDVEALQELLGKPTVNLINQLEQQKFSTTKLKQVLQDMYSEIDLITNKNTRSILFDLLNKTEVKNLLSLLNKSFENDIYEQLKVINVTSNNKIIFFWLF